MRAGTGRGVASKTSTKSTSARSFIDTALGPREAPDRDASLELRKKPTGDTDLGARSGHEAGGRSAGAANSEDDGTLGLAESMWTTKPRKEFW